MGLRQELTQKELILTQGAKALQQKLEIQRREQDKEVSAHQQILLKIRAELQDMVQHNETKMAMVNSRMEDQITRSAERHAGSYEQLAAKIGSLESQIEAEHQSYRDTEVANTNVFLRIGVQQANLRKKKERVEVDLAAHVSSIITYRLMLECRLPNMMRICVPC